MTVEIYKCQGCGDVAEITVTPTFTLNSVKCLICKGNRIYLGNK